MIKLRQLGEVLEGRGCAICQGIRRRHWFFPGSLTGIQPFHARDLRGKWPCGAALEDIGESWEDRGGQSPALSVAGEAGEAQGLALESEEQK